MIWHDIADGLVLNTCYVVSPLKHLLKGGELRQAVQSPVSTYDHIVVVVLDRWLLICF